jgi:hypothetical protein
LGYPAGDQVVKCEPISIRTETGDLSEDHRSDHGMMTELLSRVNIGEMNLDRRCTDSR